MKIKWNKYFDRIYNINSYKDVDKRWPRIKQMFKDYDVPNKLLYQHIGYTNDYINKKFYEGSLMSKYKNLNDYIIDCTINHIFCLNHAKLMGYDHILITENDLYFHKDKQVIVNVLDNMPEDYDICLLHKGFGQIKKYENKYNEYFIEHNLYEIFSTACYALSKKGINDYLNLLCSEYFFICDVAYSFLTCKKYFTTTDIGITRYEVPNIRGELNDAFAAMVDEKDYIT